MRVVRSINMHGGQMCVDIFIRPDGSFGFEQYRRDPEDPSGWFRTGSYGHRVFASEDLTLAAAQKALPWLNDALL